MIKFIKSYWDLIFGALTGIVIAVASRFKLDKIQLCYSIIILMLVCIGIFRVLRQEIEKRQEKKARKHSIIDSVVDTQKPIKAISIAQAPTKEGERLGKIILIIWGGIKKPMEKFKTFFSKFKGYMLTVALAILTLIEMCGGYINELCGGVLTIKGIAVLPVVTLVCTAVVGILSNSFTKEQRETIKTLFKASTDTSATASNKNKLVIAEIKKTIKEKKAQLSQFNKVLATQKHELATLESELATLNNTLQAKEEMFAMTPRLATEADIQAAKNDVVNCQARINDKKTQIAETEKTINAITTTIGSLESQL